MLPDTEMPTLERSVTDSDMELPEPEMPSLEMTNHDETITGMPDMPDLEMPLLERSVPVVTDSDMELPEPEMLSLDLDEMITSMHRTHDEIADLDSEPVPVRDSTAADASSFQFDDEEFDVTAVVLPVQPILEESYVDHLSETVLTDRGVVYTLIEGGSQQQTRSLVSNIGYAYTVKTQNRSSTTWRCTSRSKAVRCPVTILQRDGHFVQRREHVHPAVPDRELRQRIYSKVRLSAKQNVFKPARSIAERILSDEIGPEDVLRPQWHLLKRAANRARAKFRPKEPKTLDFDLDEGFIGADDFLVDDVRVDGQRHFVFATPFQLSLLQNAKRWYMDGTFKVVGRPFSSGQLFSINAFIEREGHQKQLPLVFVLMSRRCQCDYVAVFKTLIDRVGDLAVKGFVADFELAVWNAVWEVFPGCEMKGCAFHWSQAIWRRVQTEGLAEAYRRRGAIFRYVRSLMALQFLPAGHVRGAFENLQRRASTPATAALVGYVGRQWVDGASFTPDDWSVFRQEV